MLDDMLNNENTYDENNPAHRLLYRFIEACSVSQVKDNH